MLRKHASTHSFATLLLEPYEESVEKTVPSPFVNNNQTHFKPIHLCKRRKCVTGFHP